jgi:transcriptional regulator with XRE-family HTH domain
MIRQDKQLAILLRQFRKQKGVTQVALADRLGYDPSYISRLERGIRRPPSRESIVAICDALSLTDRETDDMLLAVGYAPKSLYRADSPALLRVPALEYIESVLLDPDLPDTVKRVIVSTIEGVCRLVDSLRAASLSQKEQRQPTLHRRMAVNNGMLTQRRFMEAATYRGPVRTAESIVEQAIDLSRERGTRKSSRGQLHPAYALLGLGIAYRYWGQLRAAEEYLVDALKIWQMKGDGLNAAQTMVALGDVYRSRSDWDRAAVWYGRATTELSRPGAYESTREHDLLVAQTLWARARVSLAMGDAATAGRQLAEAVASQEVRDSPWAMEVCSQLLGQVEQAMGHLDAAVARYQESLEYSEKVGHWHRRAETLLLLGGVCLQVKGTAEALECAKMADNLVNRDEGCPHLVARVRQLRARCRLANSDYPRAVAQYGEAVVSAASYDESLRREIEQEILDKVGEALEVDPRAADALVTGLLATWRSLALDQYGGLEFLSRLLALAPQAAS